jgi:hypothetical protein
MWRHFVSGIVGAGIQFSVSGILRTASPELLRRWAKEAAMIGKLTHSFDVTGAPSASSELRAVQRSPRGDDRRAGHSDPRRVAHGYRLDRHHFNFCRRLGCKRRAALRTHRDNRSSDIRRTQACGTGVATCWSAISPFLHNSSNIMQGHSSDPRYIRGRFAKVASQEILRGWT